MRIHHPVIMAIALTLTMTVCNQQQALAASETASDAPELPPMEAGPTAEAPSEYGIGTAFVSNLTVNGETRVNTDTMVQKIERDGRTLDVYKHSAASPDPGGACAGETHALWDSKTQNWAGCMANGEVLGESKPYTARFEWPLQVGKTWRTQPRWVDHVLRPEWSGEYWADYEVLAYEEVTVPAGRFMAFKVGTTQTQFNDWYETTWYSPELGAVVKAAWGRKQENGYGPLEGSWELVSVDFK